MLLDADSSSAAVEDEFDADRKARTHVTSSMLFYLPPESRRPEPAVATESGMRTTLNSGSCRKVDFLAVEQATAMDWIYHPFLGNCTTVNVLEIG